MSARKRLYGGRSLLNLPGYQSTAAMVAEVDMGAEYGPEIILNISDCDRKVALTFKDSLENDLYKVDTMISLLREFRKGIVRYHKEKS